MTTALLPLAVWGASLLFAIYTVLLYPLLLHWAARRWGRPVHKAPVRKRVSLIMAVHNGAPWMRAKLASILRLDYPRDLFEVLVVSDGSTDGTDDIAAEFAVEGVKLLRVARGGKAAALNAGIAQAQGEILVFTDVRQRLDPEALRNMVACFADPSVGVVSGELILIETGPGESGAGAYWRYEKWIRKNLSRLDSLFGATGACYAMRRELAAPLPKGTLLDDVHLPLRAFFQGYRLIFEESARVYDYPAPVRSEFRRKLRTLAGNYQLLAAFPELLGPRNRMWLHFASTKVARLMMPWALLAMAISSFWLPQPWRAFSLGAQAAFYGTAILDPLLPRGFPLKRVTSAVRLFVVLMAAALLAAAVSLAPPRTLWGPAEVMEPPERIVE